MLALTIDIETIPDQTEGALQEFIEEAKANFKAPSNFSKTEAVKELMAIGKLTEAEAKEHSKESAILLWEQTFAEENAVINGEENWRKTSFDGNRGQIAVIGWKINDDPAQSLFRNSPDTADEKVLLEAFYKQLAEQLKHSTGEALHTPKLIGHNNDYFDLPFLFKRSVIQGVKPCIDLKPNKYSNNIFDTMTQWAGFGNRISLDKLCKVLGVESPKNEIDGSKVWDYILAGKISEVAEYCKDDVEATYQCYRKMTFAVEVA
jgi:uncharacterized protein YjbJ (UPF0337 family)